MPGVARTRGMRNAKGTGCRGARDPDDTDSRTRGDLHMHAMLTMMGTAGLLLWNDDAL